MSATKETPNIIIRQIDDPAGTRAVEELQKEVWGVPDLDVVPLTQLVASRKAGGVLIGAFADAELVGFIYGFPSFEYGKLAHHSHMLGVKPGFRNFDLGRRLKLAQRDQVIEQGIELVTWTFDPLQSVNAYFNFAKLGVISDRYVVNFYGDDASSFLHQTGTDRFYVLWLVSSERVSRRVNNVEQGIEYEGASTLVQLGGDDLPLRSDLASALTGQYVAIEIPSDINSLALHSALQWREATRWAFTESLNEGYVVAEFFSEQRAGKRVGKYLLTKSSLLELAKS
jgi:predicted GNAT superfamily acetyltransferase